MSRPGAAGAAEVPQDVTGAVPPERGSEPPEVSQPEAAGAAEVPQDVAGAVRPQRGSEPAEFSVQEGVETENEYIGLKVAEQDGSVVQFRIKRHTPLGKLMKAYCYRQGLSMGHIMFLFDGQPVKEADTPAQLEMEHNDTIEVFQHQTGGGC